MRIQLYCWEGTDGPVGVLTGVDRLVTGGVNGGGGKLGGY